VRDRWSRPRPGYDEEREYAGIKQVAGKNEGDEDKRARRAAARTARL
jgi:hypothetical protein